MKEEKQAATENKPTEIKPKYHEKVEPPTEPTESKIKEWTKANRLVLDTQEYTEFIEAVKAQGGHVTDTFASRGSVGLSVQYMLPAGRRI